MNSVLRKKIDVIEIPELTSRLNILCLNDDCLIEIFMNLTIKDRFMIKRVTDSGLGAISSVPKLQTLSYDNLKKITGRSITYIPYLRKMSCYGCSNLVDDGLCEILRTNENLEFIDVGQCHNLSVNFIKFASEAVRLRTNGVSLIIYISKSMRHIIKLNYSISPSLHVMIPVDDLKHQYT
uniref:Uncharacterized protein n=1 Tax=Trichogramma kaykai TaxID=54128 RepID=A0ABD2WRN7_9HYME